MFTVKAGPAITDVSVTSRPADGTNTFKRGERIEVTVTFDEAVEVQNAQADGANVRINIWGTAALLSSGPRTFSAWTIPASSSSA